MAELAEVVELPGLSLWDVKTGTDQEWDIVHVNDTVLPVKLFSSTDAVLFYVAIATSKKTPSLGVTTLLIRTDLVSSANDESVSDQEYLTYSTVAASTVLKLDQNLGMIGAERHAPFRVSPILGVKNVAPPFNALYDDSLEEFLCTARRHEAQEKFAEVLLDSHLDPAYSREKHFSWAYKNHWQRTTAARHNSPFASELVTALFEKDPSAEVFEPCEEDPYYEFLDENKRNHMFTIHSPRLQILVGHLHFPGHDLTVLCQRNGAITVEQQSRRVFYFFANEHAPPREILDQKTNFIFLFAQRSFPMMQFGVQSADVWNGFGSDFHSQVSNWRQFGTVNLADYIGLYAVLDAARLLEQTGDAVDAYTTHVEEVTTDVERWEYNFVNHQNTRLAFEVEVLSDEDEEDLDKTLPLEEQPEDLEEESPPVKRESEERKRKLPEEFAVSDSQRSQIVKLSTQGELLAGVEYLSQHMSENSQPYVDEELQYYVQRYTTSPSVPAQQEIPSLGSWFATVEDLPGGVSIQEDPAEPSPLQVASPDATLSASGTSLEMDYDIFSFLAALWALVKRYRKDVVSGISVHYNVETQKTFEQTTLKMYVEREYADTEERAKPTRAELLAGLLIETAITQSAGFESQYKNLLNTKRLSVGNLFSTGRDLFFKQVASKMVDRGGNLRIPPFVPGIVSAQTRLVEDGFVLGEDVIASYARYSTSAFKAKRMFECIEVANDDVTAFVAAELAQSRATKDRQRLQEILDADERILDLDVYASNDKILVRKVPDLRTLNEWTISVAGDTAWDRMRPENVEEVEKLRTDVLGWQTKGTYTLFFVYDRRESDDVPVATMIVSVRPRVVRRVKFIEEVLEKKKLVKRLARLLKTVRGTKHWKADTRSKTVKKAMNKAFHDDGAAHQEIEFVQN